MSVVIEPAEQLEFHRPFTRSSKESLHVKNPGTEPIIFKVKTTAPKQYCVRPNAGRIEPNSEIEVQIILQPFKEELPQDFKCKDKFLVQTAPINASFEQQDITSMWSHVEKEEKASLHQHKIKCVFVNSKEEDLIEQNNHVEGAAPIPEQVTTAEKIASSTAVSTILPAHINTTDTTATRDIHQVVPTKEESPITSTPVTAGPVVTSPVVAPVAAAAPAAAVATPIAVTAATETKPTTLTNSTTAPITDNSNKELKEALEKIKRLELQLSELQSNNELRPRLNTQTSSTRKLASTVQPLDAVHQHLAQLEKPRPVEGYPPQVVLGVAVLVFIFTYLFF